ncbi:MAG: hypothetical protein ACNS62_05795 [Candidatus Cyclobacteriaceae bacterium M3_2C_046]
MFRKSINHRFWVVLLLGIIIGGFYYFYFFIIVKNKQDNLTQRGYRILRQIDQNMQEKYQNYSGSTSNYKNQDLVIDSILIKILQELSSRMVENQLTMSDVEQSISILNRYNVKPEDKLYIKKLIYGWVESYRGTYAEILQNQNRVQQLKEFFFLKQNNKINTCRDTCIDRIKPDPAYLLIGSEVIQDRKDTVRNSIHYYVMIEDLLEGLKFDNFFDNLLVRSESGQVVYSEVNQPHNYDTLAGYEKNTGIKINSSRIQLAGVNYIIFTHPTRIAGEKYNLVGLIADSSFNQLSYQINPFLVITVVTLILLILIFMPLLKLVIMSKVERLKSSDIYFSGISLILLSTMFTLLFIGAYNAINIESKLVKGQLKNLNESIQYSLNHELDQIMDQLYHFPDTTDIQFVILKDLSRKSYPEFNEVFSMDEVGFIERYICTAYPYLVSNDSLKRRMNMNLQSRDYFRYANSGKDLWIHDTSRFYMESIYSYTTGLIEAAISIPKANEPGVLALTSPIYSLLDVILPYGFQFAVISPEGEVLFHSRKNRTLRENLIQESGNSEELLKLINQRVAAGTFLNYNTIDHHAYIAPLNKTPLFLITFYPESVNQARTTFVLISAALFMLLVLGIIFILSLMVQINKSHPNHLKGREFSFHWMLPQVTSNRKYLYLIRFNLVVLVFLIWYLLVVELVIPTILIILITTLLVNLIMFVILNQVKSRFLFRQKKYLAESLIILILLLTIFSWFMINWRDGYGFLLFFSVLIFVSFYWVIWKRKGITGNNFVAKPKVFRNYNLFILTWILTVSVLPSLIFYKMVHNHVNQQWIVQSHYDIARQIELRKNRLSSENLDSVQYAHKSYPTVGNYMNFYHDSHFADFTCSDKSSKAIDLHLFDLLTSKMGFLPQPINLSWLQDSVSSIKSFRQDNRLFSCWQSYQPDYHHHFTAQTRTFGFPFWSDSNSSGEDLLYFLLAILILILMYQLVRYNTQKIRPLYFPDIFKPDQQEIARQLKLKRNILLVGLPLSGRARFMKSIFKKISYSIIEFNLVDLEESQDKLIHMILRQEPEYILLKNFEYNFNDLVFNRKKLKLLEKLNALDHNGVIICSTLSINQILDDYLNRLENKSLEKEIRQQILADIDRWEALLYNYYTVVYPLTTNMPLKYQGQEVLLKKELHNGDYLAKMKGFLSNYYQLSRVRQVSHELEEKIILKVQEMASSYYYAIWNNCTFMEKYVLYDIADDRFVNSKNKSTIDLLASKGLIKWRRGWGIMNESFRNFILTSTPGNEALKMEKEAQKRGNWNKFKLVFLIVFLAILVLFILAEQDVVNKVSAIVTALAAMVPAIYSLGRNLWSGTGGTEV